MSNLEKEDIDDLCKIAEKIDKAIKAVKNVGLTQKEIDEFEEYITHQETIQPLLNPTNFNQIFKMLDRAKKRLNVLKPIINLREDE